MDISIIIPSFNTKNLLRTCLSSIIQSLSASSVRYEIIVVDNSSRDGSAAMVKKDYPSVICIRNTENAGYGKANNIGIQKAKGEYILLLNSDIEVLDQAIEMLYTFTKSEKNMFTGGRLYNPDLTPQASSGPMFTLPVVFTLLFLKGDSLGLTRNSPSVVTSVDWVSGACLMGRKSDFSDVGLFDEHIFMYMDEIDFLYRAKQKGYTIVYNPKAGFIHVGAGSSGEKKTPILNIYTGLVYFYRKHRSKSEYSVLVMLLRLKAWIAIFLFRILGRKESVLLYEKALRLV